MVLGKFSDQYMYVSPYQRRTKSMIGFAWKIMSDSYICKIHSVNKTTAKPVLSGHSKIVKTTVLKTNGSLMKVESTAGCSLGAFCINFDLH